MNLIIVKLPRDFFDKHQLDKEILRKPARPYVQGTLIADVNNIYFVPFRTNLPLNAVSKYPYAFVKLPTKNKPDGGLDLTKTIVLSSPENCTVLPGTYVEQEAYRQLLRKQTELWEKLKRYVRGYRKLIRENKHLSEEYKYTSLRYFHRELELPKFELYQSRLTTNYRDPNFIAAPKTDKAPGFDRGL